MLVVLRVKDVPPFPRGNRFFMRAHTSFKENKKLGRELSRKSVIDKVPPEAYDLIVTIGIILSLTLKLKG